MNDEAASPPPAASNTHARKNRFAIGLALAVVIYGVGYLVWYLQTPLGRAPQLDGEENIALAQQIASGTLPREPFYRAMLYPAVLAAPLKLGLPVDDLPAFASILGLLCHFLITLGVARLAAQIWVGPREKTAALVAAAFWGLNPVALFYAVDVLDTVPSLALAVWALVWWTRPGTRRHDAWVGGVLLGLAVAARPNFFPLVFIAPLARAWLAGRWKPLLADAMAWVGAVAILLGVAVADGLYGGNFAFLPSQGPYNFYAANRPGASGKFYAQEMFFTELAPGENPARKEEELMFSQAKKTFSGPPEVYWNEKAAQAIKQNPAAWLKLEIKKAYYLLNDFDQYNNKTYAWHKAESPWLNWNFLGWGIMFVLSAGILALRGRGRGTMPANFNCPKVAGVWLVFCAYGAGVLLYYASGRFRLPLMPLLCAVAGGWAATPKFSAISVQRKIFVMLAMAGTAFLAFSNFFDAHDSSAFIQDESLSANAAAQVGDDADAVRFAKMVLARDASRSDARRIYVVSFFNFSLANNSDQNEWKNVLAEIQKMKIDDATLSLVKGVAVWKSGDHDQAVQIWQDGAGRFGAQSAPSVALATVAALRGQKQAGEMPPDPQLLELLKPTPH